MASASIGRFHSILHLTATHTATCTATRTETRTCNTHFNTHCSTHCSTQGNKHWTTLQQVPLRTMASASHGRFQSTLQSRSKRRVSLPRISTNSRILQRRCRACRIAMLRRTWPTENWRCFTKVMRHTATHCNTLQPLQHTVYATYHSTYWYLCVILPWLPAAA